jgi:hypothetical protein
VQAFRDLERGLFREAHAAQLVEQIARCAAVFFDIGVQFRQIAQIEIVQIAVVFETLLAAVVPHFQIFVGELGIERFIVVVRLVVAGPTVLFTWEEIRVGFFRQLDRFVGVGAPALALAVFRQFQIVVGLFETERRVVSDAVVVVFVVEPG